MYQELIQTFSRGQRTGMDDSLDPEQEQQDDSELGTQPESNQGRPEQRNRSPMQPPIEFRIQQLQNRHFLLLNMQRFKKKAEDNGAWTREETTCKDSDQMCELEAIQKELEELLAKKKELEKPGNRLKLEAKEGQQKACTAEIPREGIYILPPPQLTQEDITLEWRVKTKPVDKSPRGPFVPVDSLGQTPAVTKCPSCEEIIFTETHSTVGEATWIFCFLCTLTGCVAGCCLIPFCMNRLKNVHHQCPQCHANIHTHQPL